LLHCVISTYLELMVCFSLYAFGIVRLAIFLNTNVFLNNRNSPKTKNVTNQTRPFPARYKCFFRVLNFANFDNSLYYWSQVTESLLLYYIIHAFVSSLFDKGVAVFVFLVLLWGKIQNCIPFVLKSLEKIQNANRNLYTCNKQLRQVRLYKRFIIYMLHRTTWRDSIVSLQRTTKTTIAGICWWDFIETHVYHLIQKNIFPKNFFYKDFKHQ